MDDLEPVFTLKQYLFLHFDVAWNSARDGEKWQSILDELKKDGKFEKIYRSYLPNADMHDLLGK